MKKPTNETVALGVLLLFAALLRFFFIVNQEFNYDELSAIFRARLPEWNLHLKYGVYPDGHPPGVQTLLWLWLRYFGENPFYLKALASFFGCVAIVFVYRTGKQLFNPGVGLIAAAFMAFSSLTFLWSVQVRPYAFGMAVSSGLLWLWATILKGEVFKKVHFIFFALLLTLSAYIHYFCGLFGFLVFLSLIFLKPQLRKSLYTAGFAAALLFIPAMPAFMHQVQNQGLEWLGKPRLSFLPDHLFQLMSRSWVLVFLILLVGMGLLLKKNKKTSTPSEKRITISLLLMLLLPIVIGFVWSWLNKPVLQHTVLLFSAPCLFLLLAQWIYKIIPIPYPIRAIWIWPLCIVSVNLLLYFFDYNKWNLLKKEGHSAAAKELYAYGCHVGMYTRLYADGPKDVMDYHWERESRKRLECENFSYVEEENGVSLNSRIREISMNNSIGIVVQSGSSPFLIPMLEEAFGLPVQRKSYIGTEFLAFSKKSGQSANFTPYKYTLTGEPQSITMVDPRPGKNDVIVMRFTPDSKVDINTLTASEIQTWMRNGKDQIDWRSSKYYDWANEFYTSTFHCIKLADIPGINENTQLFFTVRAGDKPIHGLLEMWISKGNPYLYGVD